jgi:hypothetical protein
MTTELITKPSEALKLVRKELRSFIDVHPDAHFFICLNLQHRNIDEQCRLRATKYIYQLLGGKFTLNCWVGEKQGQQQARDVNALRVRWLTWMIRQWKAVGE